MYPKLLKNPKINEVDKRRHIYLQLPNVIHLATLHYTNSLARVLVWREALRRHKRRMSVTRIRGVKRGELQEKTDTKQRTTATNLTTPINEQRKQHKITTNSLTTFKIIKSFHQFQKILTTMDQQYVNIFH